MASTLTPLRTLHRLQGRRQPPPCNRKQTQRSSRLPTRLRIPATIRLTTRSFANSISWKDCCNVCFHNPLTRFWLIDSLESRTFQQDISLFLWYCLILDDIHSHPTFEQDSHVPRTPSPRKSRKRHSTSPLVASNKKKGKMGREEFRQALEGIEDEMTCPMCVHHPMRIHISTHHPAPDAASSCMFCKACALDDTDRPTSVAAHLSNPCGHTLCGECAWQWVSKSVRMHSLMMVAPA